MSLAKNLKKYMEARGLNQVKLAKLTGITQPSISLMLAGKHSPLSSQLEKLALTLHCSVDDLLGTKKSDMTPRTGKYLFDDGTGGHRFSNSWALRVLKNILKLNDLPDGRIHDFRHTFCSHLVEAGVDLQTVKDLAGHQSISTTEKYTHSRPERRIGAIQELWK